MILPTMKRSARKREDMGHNTPFLRLDIELFGLVAELNHQIIESFDGSQNLPAGFRTLLGAGGGLFRHLVDVDHVLIDLLGNRALPFNSSFGVHFAAFIRVGK